MNLTLVWTKMASAKQLVNINRFRGINTSIAPDLLEQGEFVNLINMAPDGGKLKQIPPAVSYFGAIVDQPVKLVASVYVSDYLKSQFVEPMFSNYAYLVIYGTHGAMVCNPGYIDSDTVDLTVIAQTGLSATSLADFLDEATTGTTSRYITGWRHDTLNEASGQDELKFSFGISGSGYAVFASMDNWATKVTGNSSATSDSGGSEFTITVNGIDTDLIAWWPGSLETGIVNEGFAGTRSYSYKIQSATAGYERFTTDQVKAIASWDEPCSHCYIGNELYFSWYGRVYKFNGDTVVSVGDGPVFGSCVENYYNHLFVGQCLRSWDLANIDTGPHVLFSDTDRLFSVGWSDVNAPDVFYPQQINEADIFVLEKQLPLNTNFPGVTGVGKHNDKCYLFTEQNVFEFSYVGLPLVMQSRNLYGITSCAIPNAVTSTPYGVVSIDFTGQLKLLNGGQVTEIGNQIDFRNSGYDGFKHEYALADFEKTYKITRFPGYIYLQYDKYSNQLIMGYYTNDGNIVDEEYDVTHYQYFLDFENNQWSLQRFHQSKVVIAPYTGIVTPISNWVNCIGSAASRLHITGATGSSMISWQPSYELLPASNTNTIVTTIESGVVRATKLTGIVIEPGWLTFGDPHNYTELHDFRIEVKGTGINNIQLVLYNYENLATSHEESNTYIHTFDEASVDKVVIFNIRKRFKYCRAIIYINTLSYQSSVEVKSIMFNHLGSIRDAEK